MNLKRRAINLPRRPASYFRRKRSGELSFSVCIVFRYMNSSVVRSSIRALRCLINAPATYARVDREIANHSINAFPCNTHGNRIRNVRQTNERDFTEVLETP